MAGFVKFLLAFLFQCYLVSFQYFQRRTAGLQFCSLLLYYFSSSGPKSFSDLHFLSMRSPVNQSTYYGLGLLRHSSLDANLLQTFCQPMLMLYLIFSPLTNAFLYFDYNLSVSFLPLFQYSLLEEFLSCHIPQYYMQDCFSLLSLCCLVSNVSKNDSSNVLLSSLVKAGITGVEGSAFLLGEKWSNSRNNSLLAIVILTTKST